MDLYIDLERHSAGHHGLYLSEVFVEPSRGCPKTDCSDLENNLKQKHLVKPYQVLTVFTYQLRLYVLLLSLQLLTGH